MFMLWTAGILKKCLVLFKIPRSHNPLINCLNSLIFLVFRYYMHDFFFSWSKKGRGSKFCFVNELSRLWNHFFFKNKKEIKKYWRWQLGGICIQKSNWVEYSACNLENTYWSNCLSKVYFSAWKKNYTGWNKRNGVQFASLDFCFTL